MYTYENDANYTQICYNYDTIIGVFAICNNLVTILVFHK